MNIGLLAEGFMNLSGAFDFINHILLAISSKTPKENNIYVFIKTECTYKKYKGVKRLYEKIKYLYSMPRAYQIVSKTQKFPALKHVKYVFFTKDLNEILEILKIDCVFPIIDTNLDIKIPNIRYLYDCQHKYYPEYFSEEEIQIRDKYFAEMCKHYCVVNSQDAKKDLIKFFNADDKLIFALPFTPKLNMEYLNDNSKLISKYNLPKRFFLMSCQFWIHKDHPTLFKAFAKLIKSETKYNDVELVCTGTMTDYRKPDYIKELTNLIDELGIKEKVHLLGLIPKIEQIEIMKKAQAVITTTLFEGGPGGGAVWDACALGVRSIVSDIPVNLEIKNDLVTFFKVKNVEDLSEKMKMILESTPPHYTKDQLVKNNNMNLGTLGNELYKIIDMVINKK